jgi:hypothetical protein
MVPKKTFECKFLKFLNSFFTELPSSCSEAGMQLIQFDSNEEMSLISDFLLYSTQSLPLRNESAFLTAIFSDPFSLFLTATAFEKV